MKVRYALYVCLTIFACWAVFRGLAPRSAERPEVTELIPAPSAEAEAEPEADAAQPTPEVGVVEADIYSVGPIGPAGEHELLLKAKDGAPGGKRYLPIIIGPFEGRAIHMALNGIMPRRPLTHDLLNRVASSCGLRVEKVTVTKLENRTFYAEVTLSGNGIRAEIDARPSDCIALAARAGCPIYVVERVFLKAGLEELDRREGPLPSLPDEVFF